MPLYVIDEALNEPVIEAKCSDEMIVGSKAISEFILQHIKNNGVSNRGIVLGFDSYIGISFNEFLESLSERFVKDGLKVKLINMSSILKSSSDIEDMVRYSLTADHYFGCVYKGHLEDFFSKEKLFSLIKEISKNTHPRRRWDVLIIYGPGALLNPLSKFYDIKFYADITREKLYRDLNNVMPIGAKKGGLSDRLKEKRLVYVDFQILSIHKKKVLKYINFYIDVNVHKKWRLCSKNLYERLLNAVASVPFRIRPIYIPGVWGGQRMKKIRNLPSSMVNCSFSLEVIPHHQSVRIKAGKEELEVPFYNLVWAATEKILGKKDTRRFNGRIPFSLNYDDTVQGGNLAIQVHPNGNYLRKHFNECIRRDESYYVVEAYPGAITYHGLQENVDIEKFYKLSLIAEKKHIPFDQDKFANKWSSKVGDLFLIPAGTLHASGANQLVLEIDSDPSRNGAEYTFHIYDYLRPDLNNNLRAIHLEHSFNVLKTYRYRSWVEKNLKQKPRLVEQGKDWKIYLLGKRYDMFYKVYRLEFDHRITQDTCGEKMHILTLVAGKKIIIRSLKKPKRYYKINYTETICIPAVLGKYEIVNKGKTKCWVTKVMSK